MRSIEKRLAAIEAALVHVPEDIAYIRQNVYSMNDRIERVERTSSSRLALVEHEVRELNIKNDAALRICPKVQRELSELAQERIVQLGLQPSKLSTLYKDLRREFGSGNSYKNILVIHAKEARQFIREWVPEQSLLGRPVIEPKRWSRMERGQAQ